MTALTNVLGTLTGPRRLRSALRQKTVAISSLLVALDGPTELRARIPAAVFGGDIFGVMSSQLREALIVPPATAPVISRSHSKHSLPLFENPLAKHQQNVFSPLAARLGQSTLTSETSVTQTTPFRNAESASSEPQASGSYSIPENPDRAQAPAPAFETSAVSPHQTSELTNLSSAAQTSSSKSAPTASALVNTLNRYWQHARETSNTLHANERIAVTEQPTGSRHLTAPEVEQVVSSVRSNSITPDAFTRSARVNKRDALNETTGNVPGRSLRSAPLTSFADRDFNFQPVNNPTPQYDDLGDRLAQILHEQALQHGIDVT